MVAGLSTGANNWCSVGAYTRLARYSDWVTKTIEYLEGIPTIDRDFVPEETPRRGQGSPREDGTFAGQTTDGRILCCVVYRHRTGEHLRPIRFDPLGFKV